MNLRTLALIGCLLGVIFALSHQSLSLAEPASSAPLIGISITTDAEQTIHKVGPHYAEAVRRGGGIPVYIPLTSDKAALNKTLDRLDGLILTGGMDLPPSAYGQKPHETVNVMPQARFQYDRALLSIWLQTKKPLLGICLGEQSTNVFLGGSLTQDIPSIVGDEVTHRKDRGPVLHTIRIEPESLLGRLAEAERVEVYSWHHQAADRIGRGLRPVAWTDDGVVEALELQDRDFGLLVQFHPERVPDQPLSKAIFQAFIRSCQSTSPTLSKTKQNQRPSSRPNPSRQGTSP